MNRGLLALAILVCNCSPRLEGAEALEHDGNVFLRSDDGVERQLPRQGDAYDPTLSCDGKQVVYVRRGPGSDAPDVVEELGDGNGNELWVLSIDAPGKAHRVLGGKVWIGLGSPKFSSDAQTVYFLKWFGNGYSTYMLRLQIGETKLLVGSAYDLWQECDTKDSVVVQEDHLKLAGGHVYLYWLYHNDGTRELVGTNKEDVANFLNIPLVKLPQ